MVLPQWRGSCGALVQVAAVVAVGPSSMCGLWRPVALWAFLASEVGVVQLWFSTFPNAEELLNTPTTTSALRKSYHRGRHRKCISQMQRLHSTLWDMLLTSLTAEVSSSTKPIPRKLSGSNVVVYA